MDPGPKDLKYTRTKEQLNQEATRVSVRLHTRLVEKRRYNMDTESTYHPLGGWAGSKAVK